MTTRRNFLRTSAAGLFGAAWVNRAQAASLPEAPIMEKPDMAPPLFPPNGRPYNPVVTLNGWTLPWRMKDGWSDQVADLVHGGRLRERQTVGEDPLVDHAHVVVDPLDGRRDGIGAHRPAIRATTGAKSSSALGGTT
jgi:hypothetical protein